MSSNNKPVVRAKFLDKPRVGGVMHMIPLDHPRADLNYCVCHSSAIVKVNEDGSVETLNTVYTPTNPVA